jgi:hypothetical protein
MGRLLRVLGVEKDAREGMGREDRTSTIREMMTVARPSIEVFQSPSPFRSDLVFNNFHLVRNTYVPCARKKHQLLKLKSVHPEKLRDFLD